MSVHCCSMVLVAGTDAIGMAALDALAFVCTGFLSDARITTISWYVFVAHHFFFRALILASLIMPSIDGIGSVERYIF